MEKQMKITGVIVTFNRLKFLKEAIEGVLTQSTPVNELIIINNASTDSTDEYLNSLNDSRLKVFNLTENLGGAGGFNYGLKQYMISDAESDYVWIMDDDTIPSHEALESLLQSANSHQDFGFLASRVEWIDGSAALMNLPHAVGNGYLNFSKGDIQVESASFVSMLIKRDKINEVGYPVKDFVIWGDDVEYSTRLSNKWPSYFVFDSVVTHKMGENTGTDILNDLDVRIPRYFYANRNNLYMLRKHRGTKSAIKESLKRFKLVVRILKKKGLTNKNKRVSVVVKGTVMGWMFNPIVEQVK